MRYTSKNIFYFLLGMIVAPAASAQSDLLQPVKEKIERYNAALLQEKIYVHTDKSFYTAGELVWFKIYAFDGHTNLPSGYSQVAYAEILDAANKPVGRAKIEMNEKGGNGSFQLPVGLSTSHYTFRAYTLAMKNLGPERFFEKNITVVNSLKTPETFDATVAPLYELNIYPEGGNLVTGLLSRVAFRASDQYGRGLQGKAYLLNQNNDTVGIYEPFKFGMGSFDLQPRAGQVYRMMFVLPDGKFVTKALPEAYDKGYAMVVEDVENNRVRVSITTNVRSGYPEIFLMVQNNQVVKTVKRAVISDGMTSFLVDKSDMGEGISQLTVFNNEKQPVSERLYFLQPAANEVLKLSASRNQYGVREQVSLNVGLPSVEAGNLSMAVFQLDSLQHADAGDITSHVWLSSELRGHIEQPSYYFSSNSAEVRRAADLLMMTHGWRRFNWEEILGKEPSVVFQPERTGHYITARVTDSRNNQPAKNIQAFLSIPGSRNKLYTGVSDENGLVRFDVKDHFGAGEVILQLNQAKDSMYRVELQSPFAETFAPPSVKPVFRLSPNWKESLVNYSIGMQAQHIYVADSIRRFLAPVVSDTFYFYGQPTATYRLDDYKRFGTMEEVLREYVREVNVGVKGSGSSLRFKLWNENERTFYTDNILVMVDGVPLFNPNAIFNFDPVRIKTLELIPKSYVLGSSVFHALASFRSYTENFEGFELAGNVAQVDYEGLQMSREFYSPQYGNEQLKGNRIPDLRNTLYWLPVVNSADVKFYTGDNKGRFLVVVQGVDAQGKTVSAVSGFEVR